MKNYLSLITCAAVMGVASIASADDIDTGSSALVLTDQQMEVVNAGWRKKRHCYHYCYGYSLATAGADAEAYGYNTVAGTATYAIAAPGYAAASSLSVAASGH